jgi:hypothetical protein
MIWLAQRQGGHALLPVAYPVVPRADHLGGVDADIPACTGVVGRRGTPDVDGRLDLIPLGPSDVMSGAPTRRVSLSVNP